MQFHNPEKGLRTAQHLQKVTVPGSGTAGHGVWSPKAKQGHRLGGRPVLDAGVRHLRCLEGWG